MNTTRDRGLSWAFVAEKSTKTSALADPMRRVQPSLKPSAAAPFGAGRGLVVGWERTTVFSTRGN
jgi:hypothetical protein